MDTEKIQSNLKRTTIVEQVTFNRFEANKQLELNGLTILFDPISFSFVMPKRNTKNSKPFPKIPTDGLLNGAVCASYARCSKPNCKCARGSLHGPYYHRYQWDDGRVIKEYIPLAQVEEVRIACARYRSLQDELREGRRHYQMLLSQFRQTLGGLSYE